MKKRKNTKFMILGVVVLLMMGGIYGCSSETKDDDQNTVADEGNAVTETEDSDNATTEEVEAPTTEPYEVELTAGDYTAGIDIPSGKYTLTVVSGSGNVFSSDIDGINEIMGTEDDDIKEFKNAKFEDGVILSVLGDLVLKISSDEANTSALVKRENALTETVELSSGEYVAGEDFPAGVYDIVAVDGYGNVSSSNGEGDGVNEIFTIEDEEDTIKEFKNANLEDGVEFSISDVTVKLVPSVGK